MSKESIFLAVFALVFVVLAMRSAEDKQAKRVLYDFCMLFLGGFVGYLLK